MSTRFGVITTSDIKEATNIYISLCNDYEDVRLEQISVFGINSYIISYRFKRN